MIWTFFQVALGGAIGATLRYSAGLAIFRMTGPGFPFATLVVNIVGSFLMGAFVVFAANKSATHFSPFVMTGLLGGFTTFSAFSLETYTLFERGQTGAAAIYVTLSVGLSILGLVLGIIVSRGVFS